MKVTWNDTVIAESDDTIEVEGNQYFPPDAVDQAYLEKTDHQTTCPWKGETSYYDIVVDGERNENAGWYYPDPKEAASEIEGYVAFWNGVEITE